MDNSETREYVKVGSFKPADEMNEKGAVIERDFYRQGNIFKDEEAYLDKEHPDKVCYIPELSDSLYTRQDFLDMCNGQEDIADRIFEAVDWQHPETYLEEQWAEAVSYTHLDVYKRQVIGCFRVTATIPAKIRTRYWHGP